MSKKNGQAESEAENAKANATTDPRKALDITNKAQETMGESKRRPTAEVSKLKTRKREDLELIPFRG